MIYEEPNHYTADEGKTFLRKVDNFIMGSDMYLYNFIDGTPDVIENYTEIDDPNPVQNEVERQLAELKAQREEMEMEVEEIRIEGLTN